MNSIHQYIEALFEFGNPIYISGFLIIVVVLVIIAVVKIIVVPQRRQYELEKEKLEHEKSKLMALFAELDPDPLIRVNIKGEMIHFNSSAKSLCQENLAENELLKKILPELELNLFEVITQNMLIEDEVKIGDRVFRAVVKGSAEFEFAQIYLSDITTRINYSSDLIKTQENLKKLTHHLTKTLEDERYRIGSDLHDHIGQMLLLTKMKMNSSFPVSKDLEEVNELMESIIESLKNIVFDLKPKLLEQSSVEASVHVLISNFIQRTGLPGKLNSSVTDLQLEYNKKLFLYRLTQEALNNIIKHSQATEFTVNLYTENSEIVLEIQDNGIGFDIESVELGNGLLNMQQRIQAFNGQFNIDSTIGNGTFISASFLI